MSVRAGARVFLLVAYVCWAAAIQHFVPKASDLLPEMMVDLDVVSEVGGNIIKGGKHNEERLAVVFNAFRGWSTSETELSDMGVPLVYHTRFLKCAMTQLMNNLASSTPVDVFIVAPPDIIRRDRVPYWISSWDNVFLYPQEDLAVPYGIADEVTEHPYVSAAVWRIALQMAVFDELGYRYILQHGDDAFVMKPLNRDLVREMSETHKTMGGYCRECFHEHWNMARGASELMRFGLIMFDQMSPVGPVYEHCSPKDHTGLVTFHPFLTTSPNPEVAMDGVGASGWDRVSLAGNWNLLDLRLWNATDVQVFIRTVIDSKALYTMRWTDLLPLSMVEQLYVGPSQFLLANEGEVEHHSHWAGLPGFCRDMDNLPGAAGGDPAVNGPGQRPVDLTEIDARNHDDPRKKAMAEHWAREHSLTPLDDYGEVQRETLSLTAEVEAEAEAIPPNAPPSPGSHLKLGKKFWFRKGRTVPGGGRG